MFIEFLYALRERGVPVGAQEAVSLASALKAGLHDNSLDGFYDVARAVMVHRASHLDDFDQAFLKVFKGVEVEAKVLKDELLEWLKDAKERQDELTDEERALFESMDRDELMRMFEERLKEQDERHDGGSKWIGTGGKSPFGHGGAARKGIRVGGKGGGRSAIKVADARRYKGYREDLNLDVRQMQVALKKLRLFNRSGAQDELDIEASIDATAANGGELDIVLRAEKRSNTRVILMMDVGGSMDPWAHLCSRLFSAAKKSTHFKELRTYYFHNCVYGQVYKTDRFDDPVPIAELLGECGPHYKLIMLGDALMAPYELLSPGGAISLNNQERLEGIAWLMMLHKHFHRAAWLNPEPPRFWSHNTIEVVREVFDMFPLTLEGLGHAVDHLLKPGR